MKNFFNFSENFITPYRWIHFHNSMRCPAALSAPVRCGSSAPADPLPTAESPASWRSAGTVSAAKTYRRLPYGFPSPQAVRRIPPVVRRYGWRYRPSGSPCRPALTPFPAGTGSCSQKPALLSDTDYRNVLSGHHFHRNRYTRLWFCIPRPMLSSPLASSFRSNLFLRYTMPR